MSSNSTLTHLSAAVSILTAVCPIALMLFRTKSTSTSDEYLCMKTLEPLTQPKSRDSRNPLLQFTQKGINIIIPSQPHHNVQLLHFHIERVIVLAEEHTHFIRENV